MISFILSKFDVFQKYIILLKKELNLRAILLLILISLVSCEKYKDPEPIDDPRLDTNFFCNDLDAVNYNWGFPGTPDESICIFPSDVLEGDYIVADSIYSSGDSFLSATTYPTVRLDILSKTYLSMKNYCPSDSIRLLCDRYLIISSDTVAGHYYDVCGLDSFHLRGKMHGMDTLQFSLRRTAPDASTGYHVLTFYKQ